MKALSFFARLVLAIQVSEKRQNALPRSLAVALITIPFMGGIVSCHRAPQANYLPTHAAVIQSEAAKPAPVNPTPAPEVTASIEEAVPLPTKPVWEETPSSVPQSTDLADTKQQLQPKKQKSRHIGKALPPSCDQIVLRNGDVIEAKIKEVGVNEIKYKKCDRQDGPDYTISKRDVLSIKYTNGDVERFNAASSSSSSSNNRNSYDSPTSPQNDGPKTDPFSIVAIAAGGLAILTGYGAFLLGAAAIVFGAMSLSRIKKEPRRFKGKGLAMGGMIAGIVAAGIILLYLVL